MKYLFLFGVALALSSCDYAAGLALAQKACGTNECRSIPDHDGEFICRTKDGAIIYCRSNGLGDSTFGNVMLLSPR